MLGIISVVTCLAEGTQVLRFAVLRCMVEVCNSEHNLHHLTRFLVHKVGVVFLSAELTAVASTFKNGGSYILPVLRISLFVFWFNRHIIQMKIWVVVSVAAQPRKAGGRCCKSR